MGGDTASRSVSNRLIPLRAVTACSQCERAGVPTVASTTRRFPDQRSAEWVGDDYRVPPQVSGQLKPDLCPMSAFSARPAILSVGATVNARPPQHVPQEEPSGTITGGIQEAIHRATLQSSAASSIPTAGTSEQSLPGPATNHSKTSILTGT